MATLPATTDLTGSAITEAQAKTWFGNLRTFLADLLGTTGTIATALAQLGVIFGAGTAPKSGAYTVIASDRGKTLNCTGTWTLSFTAAATLGDGFSVTVVNSGSGVITLDPSGSETIDGGTTLTLAAGESCVVTCTGTALLSVGRAQQISYPISVANGGTGSGATPTVSNSPQADNIKAVKHDHGHDNVGSLCFACPDATGSTNDTINPGSTFAGSKLKPCAVNETYMYGTALSGTWRCLGYGRNVSSTGYGTLWQRIS